MSDRQEQLVLIEDCEAREARLSDFERQFIDSARRQLESGAALSSKQQALLDDIWEIATARG